MIWRSSCVFPLLASAALPAGQEARVGTDTQDRLTLFTSMHCYPYNRTYGDGDAYPWVNYVDRPLAWDPFLSDDDAAKKKGELMEAAGGDVYVQTVFYAQGNPPVGADTKTGLSMVARMLKATEGTRLSVAPEIVALCRARTYGLPDVAAFFRTFHQRFRDHPRLFRHNGRIVVFLYCPFDDSRGRPKSSTPNRLSRLWQELGDIRLAEGYRQMQRCPCIGCFHVHVCAFGDQQLGDMAVAATDCQGQWRVASQVLGIQLRAICDQSLCNTKVAKGSRPMERAPGPAVLEVNPGAAVQQERDDLFFAIAHRDVKRRAVTPVS